MTCHPIDGHVIGYTEIHMSKTRQNHHWLLNKRIFELNNFEEHNLIKLISNEFLSRKVRQNHNFECKLFKFTIGKYDNHIDYSYLCVYSRSDVDGVDQNLLWDYIIIFNTV